MQFSEAAKVPWRLEPPNGRIHNKSEVSRYRNFWELHASLFRSSGFLVIQMSRISRIYAGPIREEIGDATAKGNVVTFNITAAVL